MTGDRLYLDTSFVQALLNRKDRNHQKARELLPRLDRARELWITEAVLIEVCNALSRNHRQEAFRFFEQCYKTPTVRVVPVHRVLLKRALELYRSRLDKTWGLTDCISFVVMQDQGLTEALTADEHFVQAGFRALLLEKS